MARQEWVGMEEDIEWHSAQHDFLIASLVNPCSSLTQVTQMLPSVPVIWMLSLTCDTSIPFQVLLHLSLSVHFIGTALCMLFVALLFAFQPMISNVLHGHAGKYPTNVTCNCHLVVHFMEVDSNHLCVSTQFEEPGAEWFEPYVSRDARTL